MDISEQVRGRGQTSLNRCGGGVNISEEVRESDGDLNR